MTDASKMTNSSSRAFRVIPNGSFPSADSEADTGNDEVMLETLLIVEFSVVTAKY